MLIMSVFAGGAAAWTTNSDIDDSTSSYTFGDETTDEQIKLAIADTAAGSASDVKLNVYGAGRLSDGSLTPLNGVKVHSIDGATHDTTNGEYVFNLNESDIDDAPSASGMDQIHVEIVDTSSDTVLDEQSVKVSNSDDASDDNVHFYAGDVNANSSDFSPTASAVIADSNDISNTTVGGIFGFGGESVDTTKISGWTQIDGDNSSIIVHPGAERADMLSDASSDAEAGDVVDVQAVVNSDPVVVYAEEAPETASGHTHGVYNNETGNVEFVIGEEHADDQTVTFSMESHKEPGFGVLSDSLGIWKAFAESMPSLPF